MGIFKNIVEMFSSREEESHYDHQAENRRIIDEIKSQYDMDSLAGIERIPVVRVKQSSAEAFPNVTTQLEYILQRKATEHKRNKNMDLAIACLKKSNELMPYSNITWGISDYLRLVRFLEEANRYNEADKELIKLKMHCTSEIDKQQYNTFAAAFKQRGGADAALFDLHRERLLAGEKNRKYMFGLSAAGYDLVKFSEHYPTCAVCALYQGRVFSISGKDKRFPRLPDSYWGYGKIHEGCKHVATPWVESLHTRAEVRKEIKFSNRPFADSRSMEEKALWDKQQRQFAEQERDFKIYEQLISCLPDISPKSYAGFRRMKNANTVNYQKLVGTAKEMGIDIESEEAFAHCKVTQSPEDQWSELRKIIRKSQER